MDSDYHDKKKKFKKGNPGRKPGTKNKYTRIKEMICQIVEDREEELNTMDLKTLVQFVSSTAPKETKVEVDKPVIVKWQDKWSLKTQ